jgi:hypothetical protein
MLKTLGPEVGLGGIFGRSDPLVNAPNVTVFPVRDALLSAKGIAIRVPKVAERLSPHKRR